MNKGIFILVACMLVSGCASSFKPITDIDLSTHKSIEYQSIIYQAEIEKNIVYSNAGGSVGVQFGFIGGLVGAIIDESTNSGIVAQAEKDMEPIRQALSGYKAEETINANFSTVLKPVRWANHSDFKTISIFSENKLKVSTRLDTYLSIVTTYKFADNFEYLQIKSSYSLYDGTEPVASEKKKTKKKKTKRRKAKKKKTRRQRLKKALYQNAAIYNYAAKNLLDKSKEERILVWINHNAESVKLAIENGSLQVAKMIMLDLNGEGLPTAQPEAKKKNKKRRGKRKKKTDFIISMNDETGHIMARKKDGTLVAGLPLNVN